MATPITQVYVAGVISSLHPEWENLNPNDTNTRHPHAGEIIIATIEMGYGGSEVARLNGSTLKQYGDAQNIVSGRTVIGFIRYWRSELRGSGYFTYSITSLDHPRNTMSTSINIKSS